jgi:hypothetical protein
MQTAAERRRSRPTTTASDHRRRSRDPDVLGGGAPANAGGRVSSKNPPKATRGFARGHHPPWCMQTAAERRRSRTTTAASDHPPRSRDPDVLGGGPQRMLGGGFFRKTLRKSREGLPEVTTLRGACRQRLNVDAHAPPPPPQITHRAPAIRTFWEGGPQRMLGGGFFRKTLRKSREGLPEVTTLRGACRQRLNVDAHAPPPPPQITHRAPAIRTLWEGGPSECWGEGFFEKPSLSTRDFPQRPQQLAGLVREVRGVLHRLTDQLEGGAG